MRRRRADRLALYAAPGYRALRARVAANVRRARERHGWAQEQAADRVDMATRMVQGIEAGAMNVTLVTLARLCEGLGVDVRDLFEDTPPAPKRGAGRPVRAGAPRGRARGRRA